MLFQMCYGPEIEVIFEAILNEPGVRVSHLRSRFQYREEGDISSLIEAVIAFLENVQFIRSESGRMWAVEHEWDEIKLLQNIRAVGCLANVNSPDYVFTHLYERLFVEPNQLFRDELHQHVNQLFPKVSVSREKINAWKRIMEFLGVGHRVHSGFYALPHRKLLERIIRRSGRWEGALEEYCRSHIQPTLPCLIQDRIFDGILFGLAYLHKQGKVCLSLKQDLPYRTFGETEKWNWLEVGRDNNDSMSHK